MAAKKANEAAVQEENPTRGGSYIRNADGTLTQTEGPKPRPDTAPAPAPANPTPTTQEQ